MIKNREYNISIIVYQYNRIREYKKTKVRGLSSTNDLLRLHLSSFSWPLKERAPKSKEKGLDNLPEPKTRRH